MPYLGRRLAAVTAALAMSVTTCALTSPASADSGQADKTKKTPVATGYGGAVSTVDLDASEAAIAFIRDLAASPLTVLNDDALRAFLDESEKKLG